MGLLSKLSDKIAKEVNEQNEKWKAENEVRMKIRAEEKAKADAERAAVREKQIRAEERLRAREGGLVKRTVKKALKGVAEEAAKNM
jgi:hypothetical protein